MGAKKRAPGDREARAPERAGDLEAVRIVAVQDRVRHEEVFRTGPLKLQGGGGHIVRRYEAQILPLDARVGAVDAVVPAPALRLQVEHAAPFDVELVVRARGKAPPGDYLQGRRVGFRRVPHDYALHGSRVAPLLQCVKESVKALALADDAVIGAQRLHELPREYGEPASSQHDGRAGGGPDCVHQLPVPAHEPFCVDHVSVVDVAERQAHKVGPELADEPGNGVHLF